LSWAHDSTDLYRVGVRLHGDDEVHLFFSLATDSSRTTVPFLIGFTGRTFSSICPALRNESPACSWICCANSSAHRWRRRGFDLQTRAIGDSESM
jgi:hypothetical protein